MAISEKCKISLYGQDIQRADSSAQIESGQSRAYTAGTWGGLGFTKRTNGLVSNTAASSTVVNTAIIQNNLPAYVIAQILVQRAEANGKTGEGGLSDFTTDGEVSDTAEKWIKSFVTVVDNQNNRYNSSSFILDNEITESKIRKGSVTNIKIAPNVVSGSNSGSDVANIKQNSINDSDIQPKGISDTSINDNTLTTRVLTTGCVYGSANVANKQRTNIAPASINSYDIATSGIVANNLATSSVYGSAQLTEKPRTNIVANSIMDAEINKNASIASSKINFNSGISNIGTGNTKWNIVVNSSNELECRVGTTCKFKITSTGDIYAGDIHY